MGEKIVYKKGDFHIHSTASDGNLCPLEIIKLAKKKGLDIISITDHNTMGSVYEAMKIGKNEKGKFQFLKKILFEL